MAQSIANGTRQTPQPCGIPCLQGTRETPRGAAPNPRADWLCGARRATPFIWPNVSASRIRSRLRPAASRARGAQRSPKGRAGAAGAARWRRTPCTSECNRSTASVAVRRHGWCTVERGFGARTVQARCMRGRMAGGCSDAGATQQQRPHGWPTGHDLMDCSTSTAASRCRVRQMRRWDRSSGCRTTPGSCR